MKVVCYHSGIKVLQFNYEDLYPIVLLPFQKTIYNCAKNSIKRELAEVLFYYLKH